MVKSNLLGILPFLLAMDLLIPFLLAPSYKGYRHLTQVMSVLGNSKAPLHVLYNGDCIHIKRNSRLALFCYGGLCHRRMYVVRPFPGR